MGAFLTVFHPGLYPCVISLCTIQFIPQILITFHLPQAERCAGKWGPKMQSIFGQIKIPETLNLVTERDLGFQRAALERAPVVQSSPRSPSRPRAESTLFSAP